MKNIWNFIKIALGIILAIFIYIFFTKRDNSKLMEKINEVKEEAKIEEKRVEKIKKKIENRKKEAETLNERLKKHFNILIILFIVFTFSVGVVATDTIENLKTPETYEELLEAYRDMAEIAIGYQKLYQEAEADNQSLLKVIENLQGLMKIQQEIIDDLLNKKRFSIFAGLDLVPLHLDYSGISLGLNWEF